jgi:CheY-like chemotaxis protein
VDNVVVVLPMPPVTATVANPPTIVVSPPVTAGGTVAPSAPAVVRAPHAAASILAITEDPELRDTLLEMALADGFGVRCAATEADGASVIRAERPGLVLVDLDMSTRTGVKFLRTLRASPYRDIPCIAVTASNDPMLTVSIDAPVFFKPVLDGLEVMLERLFAAG